MGTEKSRVYQPIPDAEPSSSSGGGPSGRGGPWRGGVSSWLAQTPSTEIERVLDAAAADFKTYWDEKKEEQENKRAGWWADLLRRWRALIPKPERQRARTVLSDEPELLADIVKYGEMVQSVYDTLFTKDTSSQFFGRCRKGAIIPGEKLGKYADQPGGVIVLQPDSKARDYTVLTRIYADSGAYKLVRGAPSYYVGYIAESPPDENGGVDIAVVFRGTITKSEWFQDAKALQVAWNDGKALTIVTLDANRLSAWPLGLSGTWSLLTWLGLQALSAALDAGTLAQPLTHLWSATPAAWATDLASRLFGTLGTALAWLLHSDSLGGNTQLTSACFLTGLAVGFAKGTWDALAAYPTFWEWLKDVGKLVVVLPNWAWWGFVNVVWAFLDFSQDPHVSYGFKEMYADAQNAELPTSKSPRLTVMSALLRLYRGKYRQSLMQDAHVHKHTADSRQPHIKSITVTGHSLGGALASLCAWDIANTFNEAYRRMDSESSRTGWLHMLVSQTHNAYVWLVGVLWGQKAKQDLYTRVHSTREELIRAVQDLKARPVIAAITWAAPRVGDQVFASAFVGCSLVDPARLPVKNWFWWILQEVLYVGRMALRLLSLPDGPRADGVLINLAILGGLVYKFGLPTSVASNPSAVAIWLVLANTVVTVLRELRDPPSHVRPYMLRVVDAPDVVPQVPVPLPLPRLAAYMHGGHELRVSYDLVPYFEGVSCLRSVTELARFHNLEVYLHLVDPRRCIALANRTERVLVKELAIPGAWWSPVPNNEMALNADGKTWEKSWDDNTDTSC